MIPLSEKCNAFRKGLSRWMEGQREPQRGWLPDALPILERLPFSAYCIRLLEVHAMGDYHECHILARVLLERIVNGRIAKISPERAARLMATELNNEIKGIKQWKTFEKLNDPTVDKWLAEHEAKLNELLKLLNLAEAHKWKFFELMEEVKLEPLYRTAYRDLSQYAHARFSVSAPGYGNEDCRMIKFVALLAPVDAATSFDAARNGGTSAEVAEQDVALFQEVANATVRLKEP